jgi:hypothetical protein
MTIAWESSILGSLKLRSTRCCCNRLLPVACCSLAGVPLALLVRPDQMGSSCCVLISFSRFSRATMRSEFLFLYAKMSLSSWVKTQNSCASWMLCGAGRCTFLGRGAACPSPESSRPASVVRAVLFLCCKEIGAVCGIAG